MGTMFIDGIHQLGTLEFWETLLDSFEEGRLEVTKLPEDAMLADAAIRKSLSSLGYKDKTVSKEE